MRSVGAVYARFRGTVITGGRGSVRAVCKMDELPNRKRPIHLPSVDKANRPTIIFVTACTKDRKPILARRECVATILEAWKEANQWLVGRYAIMPDHVHFFCSPTWDATRLSLWMRFWKSRVSREWPFPEDQPIWQQNFWDRQLRSLESYSEKWSYVRNNPVRHGLVKNADEWPWQGEMCSFEWNDL